MDIEPGILGEAWANSTSYPLQAQTFQVDRCVACGEIVPEGTQLCYRCKQPIEPTNIQESVEGKIRGHQMIKDFKNWVEVTRGIFRYVIAAGACYEIHLEHHYEDTNILTAKASLYISGDWCPKVKPGEPRQDYFSRECLLAHNTVQNCLEAAAEDDAKNNLDTI